MRSCKPLTKGTNQTSPSHQQFNGRGPYSRTTYHAWRTLSQGGPRKSCIRGSLWHLCRRQLYKLRSGRCGHVLCAASLTKAGNPSPSVISVIYGCAVRSALQGRECQPRSTKQPFVVFASHVKTNLDCDAPVRQEHIKFSCDIFQFCMFHHNLEKCTLKCNIMHTISSQNKHYNDNQAINYASNPKKTP